MILIKTFVAYWFWSVDIDKTAINNTASVENHDAFVGPLVVEELTVEHGSVCPVVPAGAVHLVVAELSLVLPFVFCVSQNPSPLLNPVFKLPFVCVVIQYQLPLPVHHIVWKMTWIILLSVPVINTHALLFTIYKTTLKISIRPVDLSSFTMR